MKRITFYLDFVSPYAWLAFERLPESLQGLSYSVAYRPRGAYAQTKETSIYLAEGAQGRGVGSTLYAALLDRLRDDDVYTVIAVIASPNPASAALHRSLGFEQAGVLRRVGYKFGRRIDTEFWQLMLD